MQTFLPYKSFKDSAKCLDNKRLGKQRVEAYQILKILLGLGKKNKNGKAAWENHPATKMWKGYEPALFEYIKCVCLEWIGRGYKDTVLEKSSQLWEKYLNNREIIYPKWIGNEDFHNSHESNLLRKNFEFYSKYKWDNIPLNMEYIWLVN